MTFQRAQRLDRQEQADLAVIEKGLGMEDHDKAVAQEALAAVWSRQWRAHLYVRSAKLRPNTRNQQIMAAAATFTLAAAVVGVAKTIKWATD